MKSAQKKQIAKELYMLGNHTQKELAQRVGVTENTMGKWCKEWKPIKAAATATKNEVIQRIDEQINKVFEAAEKESRSLTSTDTDMLSKLSKIRESMNKEIGLSIIMQVFIEYNNFLMSHDSELCRQNNKYQDQFVNLKASGTN